jgi:hypothetical protein
MAPPAFLAHLKREALARLPIRPGDPTQRRNLRAVNQKRSDDQWGVPSVEDAEKATDEQIEAFNKYYDALPKKAQKRLDKWQKDHGLTRNQLILAALNEWAPQYVPAFKAAEFFGIV